MHLKSEKHLVNSGELHIEDCLACGVSFNTSAKRQSHLVSTRHIKKLAKFEKIMQASGSLIVNEEAYNNYEQLEDKVKYVEAAKTKVIKQFKQKLEIANNEIERLENRRRTIIKTNVINCVYCNSLFKTTSGYTKHLLDQHSVKPKSQELSICENVCSISIVPKRSTPSPKSSNENLLMEIEDLRSSLRFNNVQKESSHCDDCACLNLSIQQVQKLSDNHIVKESIK
jgi:hypothetical protein